MYTARFQFQVVPLQNNNVGIVNNVLSMLSMFTYNVCNISKECEEAPECERRPRGRRDEHPVTIIIGCCKSKSPKNSPITPHTSITQER